MALYEFKLPDIGEGVVEGEIVKWLVKAGDTIKEDTPLVEVMTDKATVTIPSPKKGTVVRTFGREGEVAKVHFPLLELEVEGASSEGARAKEAPAPVTAPAPARAPEPAVAPQMRAGPTAARPGGGNGTARAAPAVEQASKVLATPVTRRMAREHAIDLAAVPGTGPQGRVLKADLEAAIARGSGDQGTARAPGGVPLPTGADQRVPLRGLRKKIAEKMVRSKFTAPHYTFVEEIDVSQLVATRAHINQRLAEGGQGDRISFLPFVCKALVQGFRRFPWVNANMDEASQELVVRGQYNIGIAAMTEQGLTVPVVKQVDRLSIRALSTEINRLATAAREQRLKLEELSGGTFTVTSLGPSGGLFATPIINHPEVAIMGVHRMRKRPVVTENDQIVVREMCLFSFCFDHRVIDGALGADFAYEVLRHLERPELLLLELT